MAFLAPSVGSTPGLYKVCTNANSDYTFQIPAGAKSVVVWFTATAAADDNTIVQGRIAVAANSTAQTLNGTDNKLGYHPPVPVEYKLRTTLAPYLPRGGEAETPPTHLHLASPVAGAVARGFFLFGG